MTSHLIVNADDLGQSPGINRGIFRAAQAGIVTSTSLMVRWPAAAEAVRLARAHPHVSLGLHFDLGEWALDSGWHALYEVVPLADTAKVSDELQRQFDRFVELVGRTPTHLDSHQHVHRKEPVRSAASKLADELGIPLRDANDRVRYIGHFYGQDETGAPCHDAISTGAFARIIESLGPGTYELGCHPGDASDLETMYRAERRQEVSTLCDPAVAATIAEAGLHLISFRDVESCPQCRAQQSGEV